MSGESGDSRTAGQRPPNTLLESIPNAAAIVGGIGGLLGLVYVIGGAVMWLRFDKAGFPADQAVALIPKADLLVVGLRVLVIPALGAAIILVGLASIRLGRQRRYNRLALELEERLQRRSPQA